MKVNKIKHIVIWRLKYLQTILIKRNSIFHLDLLLPKIRISQDKPQKKYMKKLKLV
jgi:hypothetical protein